MKYPHIATSARITVRTIAGCYQPAMTPDEILQSLPHLTQSQLHAALTGYFDHQKTIDRDLKQNADVDYRRGQVRKREFAAA